MRPPEQIIPPQNLPDYPEQYRYQQEQNRRRRSNNQRHDVSAPANGMVIAVDGQSRNDYDKMIKDNFKFTQDNYGAALKEAARKGVPVVAVFGGWENNNSRSLIQESLPQARQGAAKDAVFVYIDRAKCKDAALAKFADSQLAGGHNAAVSLVFTVKPDANGQPLPEESKFRWQGGHSSMIGSFNQAIVEGKSQMAASRGKFDLSEEVAPFGGSSTSEIPVAAPAPSAGLGPSTRGVDATSAEPRADESDAYADWNTIDLYRSAWTPPLRAAKPNTDKEDGEEEKLAKAKRQNLQRLIDEAEAQWTHT